MLDRVRGKVLEKTGGRVVVETGGLGLSLQTPLSTFLALPQPQEEVVLMTRLIIREESWDLFGFLTKLERETFDILTSVSRVGPKLALTIISAIEPAELAQVLMTQDLPKLAAIKGIGLKTAERLIVELKDKAQKLASLFELPAGSQISPISSQKEETLQALINLGYSRAEAEKAYRAASTKLGAEAELSLMVREALKNLAN
ncbi:MAG: Holliday junction branch migration protein RuvA [Deltaproteobacteria bacterium]|jgi:Holliday junction DNA helicase RuvA|nr:Holliday junction branch migration protein RuvA [Deltaproteobacteria bacterium]